MAYHNSGNRFQQTTPIVLNLIIINVLVFLAQVVLGGNVDPNPASDLFALHHYKSTYFQPYQIVTHLFMHGGIVHLLFNMFALWMFGSMVERAWGPKRFLIFYFICGLGAGLFQMGSYIHEFWQLDHNILAPDVMEYYQSVMRRNYTVGASGAIMGVLAAFGYLFPNTELIIIPIPIPIKAKWAILGMIAIDVFGGVVKVEGDNIAHFAHIGGALIGFLLVLYWNKKNKKTFY
jgi:membrane associated rhomboid family serine protease